MLAHVRLNTKGARKAMNRNLWIGLVAALIAKDAIFGLFVWLALEIFGTPKRG